MTLSPFHSYQDFFGAKDTKEIVIPDQENCLVLPPPLRKPLSYRLVVWLKAEQWVFFGVHTGPQRRAQLSFLPWSWSASQGLWLFGQVKSKAKNLLRSAKQEKQVLA